MPKIIRGLYNLPDPAQGCVATIGNFDGVHLGHQAVLTQLAMKADMLNLPAVVITLNRNRLNILYQKKRQPDYRAFVKRLRRFVLTQSRNFVCCGLIVN